MPQPKENLYTVDYINSLPEDERAEIIDGVIYNMAPPNVMHQRISNSISFQLNTAINKNHGECEVFAAPFGVKLDDYNYFEPDIALVCDKRKLENGKHCEGVPELIMEVVSPSSIRQDYILKLNKYTDAGIFEYWIIDPKQKHILVYSRSNNYEAQSYKITDEISVGIIKNCKIKLDLF